MEMNTEMNHTITLLKKYIPRNFYRAKYNTKNIQMLKTWIGILQEGIQHKTPQTIQMNQEIVQNIVDTELNYSPSMIYNELKNTSYQIYSFIFQIGLRHIRIYFHIPVKKVFSYTKCKIQKHFEKIYLWFHFITKYAPKQCSTDITVKLYFTNHKKTLNHLEPLDKIHVNSAFTTSCLPKTSIYIFREEEWFKVLMHESFHNLGLDFSSMDDNYSNTKILALYPITSPNGIRIYESYCETWATFFNSLFQSFFSTREKSNTDKIVEKTIAMMELECYFSLVQCAKILAHYDLTYQQLVSNKKEARKFVEKSHVLSYYIVKSVLLCNFDGFLTWCRTHNSNTIRFTKTYKNIDSYIKFITDIYKQPTFLEKMDYIQNHVVDNFRDNSLRMSLFGR